MCALLTFVLCLGSFSFVFANDEGYEINSIDSFKDALNDAYNDGACSQNEKEQLISETNPQVIDKFLEEKTASMENLVTENIKDADMNIDVNGNEYYSKKISAGDHCAVKIEIKDEAENTVISSLKDYFLEPTYAVTHSGSSTSWKDYGYRQYTAKTVYYYGVASGTIGLEVHYYLSSNGIKLRYGTPIVGDSGLMNVTANSAHITDQYAKTPGASNTNIYATYKVTYGESPTTWSTTYKMAVVISYLAIDKLDKQIHCGHSWKCYALD